MIPDLTPTEVARFYGKLHLAGCGVRWVGPVNNHGYGRFGIYRNGKRVRILAHRLAYKLATGEDPGSSKVRHGCDSPPCCTPDCLLTGTQADNIRDAVERGRVDLTGLALGIVARQAAIRDRIESGRKRCSRCRLVKSFDEFHRARRSADGRNSWCKVCAAESRGTSPEDRKRIRSQRRAVA